MASFYLWRGRANDLLTRRAEAVESYRAVIGMRADPAVIEAARLGIRHPYARKAAHKIDIEFAYGDVIHP